MWAQVGNAGGSRAGAMSEVQADAVEGGGAVEEEGKSKRMAQMIPSYSDVYTLGHKAMEPLWGRAVYLEEKIDGSQVSFRAGPEGLECRSKGACIHPEVPPDMFKGAVKTMVRLAPKLLPNHIYRGEVLSKPKHNALSYSRVPFGNVILFDVEAPDGSPMNPVDKHVEADRIELECVPVLASAVLDREGIMPLIDNLLKVCDSVLGGQKIEGVVIKPLPDCGLVWGPDKKLIIAKYVSERFKEVNRTNWKISNPQSGDILERLAVAFTTEARWEKAVQHLRDAGNLEGIPRDIGSLIPAVQADIEKEEREQILDVLWAWAWPHLRRQVIHGLPEWYKRKLASEGL